MLKLKKKLMQRWMALYAYVLGIVEFRSDCTSYFDGHLIETYDSGRELAHVVTLRRFES